MADRRRWWKFWTCALSDDALEGLDPIDWARWARLALYVAEHGTDGTVLVDTAEMTALRRVLYVAPTIGRKTLVAAVLQIVNRLPNVHVTVDGERHTVTERPSPTNARRASDEAPTNVRRTSVEPPSRDFVALASDDGSTSAREDGHTILAITFRNWRQYQEDRSRDRMRKLRERQRGSDGQLPSHSDDSERHTVTETASLSDGARREEKRREPPTPLRGSKPTTSSTPRYPPEMFHDARTCSAEARLWPPRTCVDRAWLDAHPEVKASGRYPATRSGEPLTCEGHR